LQLASIAQRGANPQQEIFEVFSDNLPKTTPYHLVQGGKVYTPSREACSLEGITRGVVLDLARLEGLEVIEGFLHSSEIERADEMFLTSTTREVVPIVRVGERVIAGGKPGPITRRLRAAYLRALEGLIQED